MGLMRDAHKYFDFWVRSVTVHDSEFWERVLDAFQTDLWRTSDPYAKTCLFLMELANKEENKELRAIVQANYLLGIREEGKEFKEPWLQSTLRLAEECGTPRAKLDCLRAVRTAHFVPETIAKLRLQILDLAPLVSVESHVYALLDYGRSRQFASDYEGARQALNHAQALTQGIEFNFKTRYELFSAIAMLEAETGNPQLALELYQNLTDEVHRNAIDRDIAFHHCNVAQQLIPLKRYEEAQEELAKSETICGYMPIHDVRALTVLLQAEVAEMQGDVPLAHRVWSRGEGIFNHPRLESYRFRPFWKYYRTRFLRRIGHLEDALKVRPALGIEPYLDACILAEEGFTALTQGHSAAPIISRLKAVIQNTGFPPQSEPGQLLAALKRAEASSPEQRVAGEALQDFPPKLTTLFR